MLTINVCYLITSFIIALVGLLSLAPAAQYLQPLSLLALRVEPQPETVRVLGTFLEALVEVVLQISVEEGQQAVTVGELPLVPGRGDALAPG